MENSAKIKQSCEDKFEILSDKFHKHFQKQQRTVISGIFFGTSITAKLKGNNSDHPFNRFINDKHAPKIFFNMGIGGAKAREVE